MEKFLVQHPLRKNLKKTVFKKIPDEKKFPKNLKSVAFLRANFLDFDFRDFRDFEISVFREKFNDLLSIVTLTFQSWKNTPETSVKD